MRPYLIIILIITITIIYNMATAEPPSSIVTPDQQQQAGPGSTSNPEAVPISSSGSAWQSSGSIGPFFAVMSVLTLLAVLSCYLGRRWSRRATTTPLESITRDTNRDYFGWVKRLYRECTAISKHVGAKVMVYGQEIKSEVKDGEIAHQNPTHV